MCLAQEGWFATKVRQDSWPLSSHVHSSPCEPREVSFTCQWSSVCVVAYSPWSYKLWILQRMIRNNTVHGLALTGNVSAPMNRCWGMNTYTYATNILQASSDYKVDSTILEADVWYVLHWCGYLGRVSTVTAHPRWGYTLRMGLHTNFKRRSYCCSNFSCAMAYCTRP